MAKIGNEAKLILRLFEERVNAQLKSNAQVAKASDEMVTLRLANQNIGLSHALSILKSIHLEITED